MEDDGGGDVREVAVTRTLSVVVHPLAARPAACTVNSPADGNTHRRLRSIVTSTVSPTPQLSVSATGPGGLIASRFGVTSTPNVAPSVNTCDGVATVTANGAVAPISMSLLTPAAVAVTRAGSPPDNVTLAEPRLDVSADVVLSVPAVVENVTGVPSTLAPWSLVTRAVTVTLLPLRSTVVGNAESITRDAVGDGRVVGPCPGPRSR